MASSYVLRLWEAVRVSMAAGFREINPAITPGLACAPLVAAWGAFR